MNNKREGITAVILLLSAILLGKIIGHGWLGHGLYKLVLVFLPIIFKNKINFTKFSKNLISSAIISGVCLGGTASLLLYFLLPALVDIKALRENFDSRYYYTPLLAVSAAVLIATINSFIEEYFYRGFLDNRIGITASSSIFALQHIIVLWELTQFLPLILTGLIIFPAGLIWSLIYKKFGIYSAWISHTITDMILLTAGLSILGYFN